MYVELIDIEPAMRRRLMMVIWQEVRQAHTKAAA
jgi:hypothetical protein